MVRNKVRSISNKIIMNDVLIKNFTRKELHLVKLKIFHIEVREVIRHG